MRNLLFGVILGLFAFVHSTPVDTVATDNIYHEAMTDGYLIDNYSTTARTTQSPTRNATVKEFQWLSSESKETDVIEDSHLGDSYTTQIPLPDDDQSREIDLEDSNYNSMTSAAPQQEKEHYATTTPSVTDPQSSTSTELSMDREDTSDPDPTQTSESHFTSSSMPKKVMTSISPDSILDFQATDPSFSTDDFWSSERSKEEAIHQQSPTKSPSMTLFEESEGSGSGSEQETDTIAKMITKSNQPQEETSTKSSTFTTAFKMFSRMDEESEGSGSGFDFEKENQPQEETSTASSNSMTTRHIAPRFINGIGSSFEIAAGPVVGSGPVTVQPPAQHAGHSTPGWIIIVGFIAGVAALVMLCVAIATRDKWNKSKYQPQVETKTNTTNQQRELEMETFLHKDHPTENGKAAEYTVIPLDELPEKFSSH